MRKFDMGRGVTLLRHGPIWEYLYSSSTLPFFWDWLTEISEPRAQESLEEHLARFRRRAEKVFKGERVPCSLERAQKIVLDFMAQKDDKIELRLFLAARLYCEINAYLSMS